MRPGCRNQNEVAEVERRTVSQELPSSRRTAEPLIGDCLKERWPEGKPTACTSKEGAVIWK